MDKQIAAPVGFGLIFPGMLSLATRMGLEFPAFRQADIDEILHVWKEDMERFVSGNTLAISVTSVLPCLVHYRPKIYKVITCS
jgi:hypothetical protein